MPPALAHVLGVGMACPVGLRSQAALAAIRAGVVRFTEVDELVGPGGPVRASMLATLGHETTRTERAALFARHAVREALVGLAELGSRPLPCFFALPEPGVGPPLELEPLMRGIGELGRELGLTLRNGRPVLAGRAGVFEALEAALTSLAGGDDNFALVAGIDSHADPQTLAMLADSDRLLGRTNLDGLIPGEGAACLLLCRPNAVTRRQVLAELVATAVAREPLPFIRAADRVSAAEGLSSVFHKLRTEAPGRVDHVFAGTTGQSYFGREFAHAYLKNEALMP